jgi:Mg-chelatase subunit ChlD
MAQAAAREALRTLGPSDCFGLISFDAAPQRVVALAPVGDRTAAESAIAKVQAGGGTDIFSGLDAGFQDVRAAGPGPHRSVLLVTDGQSPQNGLKDLVLTMAAEGVTLSTIGLGSGIDERLLRALAEQGGGRAFRVHDPAELPGVVVGETRRLTR